MSRAWAMPWEAETTSRTRPRRGRGEIPSHPPGGREQREADEDAAKPGGGLESRDIPLGLKNRRGDHCGDPITIGTNAPAPTSETMTRTT